MVKLLIATALTALLVTLSSACAEPLAKELFGAEHSASRQKAAPYGSYAKGCLAGGEQLPETGGNRLHTLSVDDPHTLPELTAPVAVRFRLLREDETDPGHQNDDDQVERRDTAHELQEQEHARLSAGWARDASAADTGALDDTWKRSVRAC